MGGVLGCPDGVQFPRQHGAGPHQCPVVSRGLSGPDRGHDAFSAGVNPDPYHRSWRISRQYGSAMLPGPSSEFQKPVAALHGALLSDFRPVRPCSYDRSFDPSPLLPRPKPEWWAPGIRAAEAAGLAMPPSPGRSPAGDSPVGARETCAARSAIGERCGILCWLACGGEAGRHRPRARSLAHSSVALLSVPGSRPSVAALPVFTPAFLRRLPGLARLLMRRSARIGLGVR